MNTARIEGRINDNLTRYREAASLSVMQLAAAANMNMQTLYRWERGDVTPTLDRLKTIGDVMGVTLMDLLEDDPGTVEMVCDRIKRGE